MHLRTTDLHTTQVDGQTVILDTVRSNYLTTNVAGSVLVDALRADVTETHLVRVLQDEFGITAEAAETDCAVFLAQLREHDFLVG